MAKLNSAAPVPIWAAVKSTEVAGISLCALEVVALALHVRAATSARRSPAARRPYRFTSVALALLVVAGVGFAVAFRTGDKGWGPVTLVAVVPRLLIVPVLLAGLLSMAAGLGRLARWKLAMDMATVLGASLMLMWYLVLGPALRGGGLLQPLRLGAVLFALGDVVLIVGVGSVLLRGPAPAARRPLSLLLGGTVGYLVIDAVFLYQVVHGVGPEVLAPAALHLPVLLILLAAVVRPGPAVAGAVADRPLPGRSWLPYTALAGGYALLVVAAVKTGMYPWLGLVAGAIVMTVGVAARQVLAARENYALGVTDSLTGLANRRELRIALRAAVDRQRRTGNPMAALVLDLNGFKQVNDNYGHAVGDRMLVAFAEILRRTVRAGDVAARLGGDEFAVLLPELRRGEDAIAVAERILAACNAPLLIGGNTLHLKGSIGIAIAESAADAPELPHRADIAMYAAKRSGTLGWVMYSAEAVEAERAAAALAEDLAAAVPEGQLRLLYQPIVALATGDLVAAESLVRWQHPRLGLLGPDRFIPAAERTGLINEIGAWVLGEACRQVGQWQAMLPPGRSMYVSVNLSPVQLEQPDLAAAVLAVLDRTGYDPRNLVLEITESALVDDRSAVPQLEELRRHGVRIALDDFGTGYSSLRYLTRLPVDILKLDRCFVNELNGEREGAAVAEAVIRLSQILHMDTVAEGIEHEAQATELTLLGYRNAQGYFYARPLPPADLEARLPRVGSAAVPSKPGS
ncbi:bifunctional diguanylate cyclase/phosphodiesterase [Dactylosporangium vinaceum]|uniref:Bifunctional diguanylate cyclase/phosphodiesterase n=1 Tax=Dactylosporangium vinaceum TaxID=53362 RepID=A0ABV5LZM1_9ACTN|nr:bifunctional diguanylate cyclase/phosphodiesterase [Dactylosporangium vinaceum]UAB92615.1 bifunctional diguanylate cyclase/phosphodiesterase [Dactylosporangium vinaceum]